LISTSLADRHATRLLQGLGEQPVGALAPLVGAEEVRLLEEDAIHLLGGQELLHVDRPGATFVEGLELLGGELDVLTFAELVALDHPVLVHHLAVLGAEVLLLQA